MAQGHQIHASPYSATPQHPGQNISALMPRVPFPHYRYPGEDCVLQGWRGCTTAQYLHCHSRRSHAQQLGGVFWQQNVPLSVVFEIAGKLMKGALRAWIEYMGGQVCHLWLYHTLCQAYPCSTAIQKTGKTSFHLGNVRNVWALVHY